VADGPSYVNVFVEGFKEAGVTIAAALPESHFKTLYHHLEAGVEGIHYVPVASELELPGIVTGAYLGGRRAVMIMENSGIRQACEPLARLSRFGMPMVMLMPFRGDLGEPNWWGHTHRETMVPILDALRIPYWYVRQLSDVKLAIKRAFVHAESSMWPVALVFTDECVEGAWYATP
jgi:sulfopyruvate decarboxylase subunit alpha